MDNIFLSFSNLWGPTPEQWSKIATDLSSHPDWIHLSNKSGWTFLHFAAQHGNESMVEELLHAGSNINAQTDCGWSPLHVAVRFQHKAMVKRLLQAGCVVDLLDCSGSTPLHYAARDGYTEVVKLLVQAGSDFDAPDDGGWTPLHFTIRYNKIESTTALLKAVGATVLNFEDLAPAKIEKLHLPMEEEEMLKLRGEIYFDRSLVDRFIFVL